MMACFCSSREREEFLFGADIAVYAQVGRGLGIEQWQFVRRETGGEELPIVYHHEKGHIASHP